MSEDKPDTNELVLPQDDGEGKDGPVKDKTYFINLICQEAALSDWEIQTVLKNGRLSFLHHGEEALTDYRRFCLEEELGRPPVKEELRRDFEDLIQRALDEELYVNCECYLLEELLLVTAEIVCVIAGEEWYGDFQTLHALILEPEKSNDRLTSFIPTVESLRENFSSIEHFLARFGIRVSRNRTVEDDRLTIQNMNFDSETKKDESVGIIELPTFANDGYELVNGVVRNEQNPLTFEIPSDEEKDSLAVGDVVELGFEIWVDEKIPHFGERMHVKIIDEQVSFFIGKLLNLPISMAFCDVDFTKDIFFKHEHVIGITKNNLDEGSLGGETNSIH